MYKNIINIWRIWTVASLVGATVLVSPALAATVTSANDYPTTLQAGQVANHRALFTTPSGVTEGQTVTLSFSSSFDTASVTEDDIDIADDAVDLTTATDCTGTEQASVAIAADVVTFTICAGDGGAIAATSQVTVEIGTNATASGTGANRIINPSNVGTYFVTLGGTFGDFGSIALPISASDDTVAVSVTVPNISSGGSGGSSAGDGGGGGGGGDITPAPEPQGDTTMPTISNIVVSGLTETTATITWTTNESADSAVDYGLTTAFEIGTISDATSLTDHSIALEGLSIGKRYSFRVRSKDTANNEAVSATQTFTTLDLTAPTISAITATDITESRARVTWSTDEVSTSTVEYGTNVSYGGTQGDNGLTTEHSVILTDLTQATQYHFRVRSVDPASNSALSLDNTFTTGTDNPPANVSGLTITKGNRQLVLSWTNPTDDDLTGVRVVECTDTTPSSQDDTTGCAQVTNALATSLTRTGLTNNKTYYYGVFAFDNAGQFASGAVGSGTPTALEEEVPSVEPVPEVPSEIPTEEPSEEPAGESGAPETGEQPEEVRPSQPTLSGARVARIERADLEIVVAGGSIVLSLGKRGIVDVLPRTQMRLQVSQDEFTEQVEVLKATVGDDVYLLRLADQQGGNALYFADITAPEIPQLYAMSVSAEYSDGLTETVSSFLNVLPWGRTVQVIDDEEAQLGGVKITLSQVVAGKQVVWDGSPYGQFNPVTTGSEGTFGWYVPNGTYRLLASATSYLPNASDAMSVDNHIVNPRVVMVFVPPLKEEPTDVKEAVKQATAVIAGSIKNLLDTPAAQTVQKTVKAARESEAVQKTANLATPTIAVTAGASVLIMAVVFDLLPFLQYLFTAPVLLLWRRKRRGFGVVYNSISRLPVDLAVVRLFLVEDETKPGPGRLVKSRVTDKAGRFFFLIQPGTYRITVTKAGMTFPTDHLKEVKDDGTYLDVYHGELIRVTEKDAVITPNVPLDPTQAGQTQRSKRVVWQGRLRVFQRLVAVSGVAISLAVWIIRPSVLAAVMIGIQVLVYLLARRLAKPRKPKSWGIVYDSQTKRPIAKVVARVFEPKYNKLLDTVVTDSRGRYAFLLGPSEYYAVFQKQGYRPTQVRPIDLRGKEGGQDFGVDVEMYGEEEEKLQ